MRECLPAAGPLVVMDPAEDVRSFCMAVQLPELRPVVGKALAPWVRVTAHHDTGDIRIAAGITVHRLEDTDDGA